MADGSGLYSICIENVELARDLDFRSAVCQVMLYLNPLLYAGVLTSVQQDTVSGNGGPQSMYYLYEKLQDDNSEDFTSVVQSVAAIGPGQNVALGENGEIIVTRIP